MKGITKLFTLFSASFLPGLVSAHFLVLVPEADTLKKREVSLFTEFTHPAEGGPAMHYEIESSGAFVGGKVYPIRWSKKEVPACEGCSERVEAYEGKLKIVRPGVYQIFVEQKPYWEPHEGVYIKQIAKVYVDAFGLEEGWQRPVGLKVEIVPLVRPFGFWEGNTFVGRVYKDGEPLPHARVEIEYYNQRDVKYPNEILYTQVVETDERGYFYYTVPWSGWWGFAAITEGETYNGKPLELDAVLWIYAYPKPEGVK